MGFLDFISGIFGGGDKDKGLGGGEKKSGGGIGGRDASSASRPRRRFISSGFSKASRSRRAS